MVGVTNKKALSGERKGEITGKIIKISGPVVVASGMRGILMYELVRVSEEGLIGEVIQIKGDNAIIQVYEETTGIKPGSVVRSTGASLSVELGPGIIGGIYDGIQRPLLRIKDASGDFIARGINVRPLDDKKKWHFLPSINKGDKVEGGAIIGSIRETSVVEHRILVPPSVSGVVSSIVKEGDYTIDDVVAVVKNGETGVESEIRLSQKWSVRTSRPIREKRDPSIPLITGMRVIDTFFPIPKGGTAAIPGGFGTGKTVTQQSLAKWSDADIIVYIGCGERGNEMTDVLKTFPSLKDPRSGKPLMERTVIIANTSNMPVAAREASIYTGVTIAEYFRDMGYAVALMADSTSRWAEALREISGRLEELPGEEGYPAYLASRLSQFYERAGRVESLNGKEGSISIIGAVSPPGGDFSEPVTQNTLRVTKVFWALDKNLASRRHFPGINWLESYSLYLDQLEDWFSKNIAEDWNKLREQAMILLQKEENLQEIVQLVGPDALPESERLILEVSKMIREDFLQQNAFHEVDAFCSPEKQYKMLKIILTFYELAGRLLGNVPLEKIAAMKIKTDIARMKEHKNETFDKKYTEIITKMQSEFKSMEE